MPRHKLTWLTYVAGAGALMLFVGLWLLFKPVNNDGRRPPLMLVSALPFGWQGQDIGAVVRGDGTRSPLSIWLDHFFTVTPVDHIIAGALDQNGVLLLAQPRRLAPEELVEIDRWVRQGGRVLVLDDPELHWTAHQAGADIIVTDRRPDGPPSTSLLDPLVNHWGVRLELPSFAPTDSLRASPPGDGGGVSVGTWTVLTPACRVLADPSRASCQIEKGRVDLIADADWIAPDIWYGGGDPLRPYRHISTNAGALVDAIDALSNGPKRNVAMQIGKKQSLGFPMIGLGVLLMFGAALWALVRGSAKRRVLT